MLYQRLKDLPEYSGQRIDVPSYQTVFVTWHLCGLWKPVGRDRLRTTEGEVKDAWSKHTFFFLQSVSLIKRGRRSSEALTRPRVTAIFSKFFFSKYKNQRTSPFFWLFRTKSRGTLFFFGHFRVP